jgi:hypothetical protein
MKNVGRHVFGLIFPLPLLLKEWSSDNNACIFSSIPFVPVHQSVWPKPKLKPLVERVTGCKDSALKGLQGKGRDPLKISS